MLFARDFSKSKYQAQKSVGYREIIIKTILFILNIKISIE